MEGKCPLGHMFIWNRNHRHTGQAEVTSVCDIQGKHREKHRETNFMCGRSLRSNFNNEKMEWFCVVKELVQQLSVFKANILWKPRNTQLRGNTVGFCHIFSCFTSELVSESLFASQKSTTKHSHAAAGDGQCHYGASVNSGGVFCVYISD